MISTIGCGMRNTPGILVQLIIALFLCLPAHGERAPLRIAVLGDSLTAGYGLPAGEAFPRQLEVGLRSRGFRAEVIDAGVSGDTTAGGLARLEWTLAEDPDMVIVELGANDALRGLDPRRTRENLDAILGRLKKAGVTILLTGMRAPRNLGEEYYSNFNRIFQQLAEKHQVTLYPYFLEGVAGRPDLNQRDGIHPNAEGVKVIVDRMLPVLEELISNQ